MDEKENKHLKLVSSIPANEVVKPHLQDIAQTEVSFNLEILESIMLDLEEVLHETNYLIDLELNTLRLLDSVSRLTQVTNSLNELQFRISESIKIE